MRGQTISTTFRNEGAPLPDLLDDIEIQYQPIFQLGDINKIVAFEALGRKLTPQGPVSIRPYIDEIHAAGLRQELELMTLERACIFLQNCALHIDGVEESDLGVSVNLHHRTLVQKDIPERFREVIDCYPLAKGRIRGEILEDPFPGGSERDVIATVERLCEEGIKLYLDDFGDHPGLDEIRLRKLKPFIYGVKISGNFWEKDIEARTRILDYLNKQRYAEKVWVVEGVETDDQLMSLEQMRSKHEASSVLAQGWHPELGPSMTMQQALTRMNNRSPGRMIVFE